MEFTFDHFLVFIQLKQTDKTNLFFQKNIFQAFKTAKNVKNL